MVQAAAVALIGPLPWELPYGCRPEKKKNSTPTFGPSS